MTGWKNIWILGVTFTLFFCQSALAATPPLEKIREKVDAIINVVADAKKKETLSSQDTENKLWEIVNSIFDFSILSQKAMGKKWRLMNQEEQTEFISLFKELLGQSYLSKIKGYENEKTQYHKEILHSPEVAEVFTTITSTGKEFALNYRLVQRNDDWKIYDVSIEGVSLLSNYRSQFNDFLQKKSIQELIENLRVKVKERKNQQN